MLKYRRLVALMIAAIAISFAAVGTTEAAFDKDELKCRKGLAKGMLKAISTADKVSGGCHKSRHSGKESASTDCNDLGSAPGVPGAADGKGKFAKAQQKLIDTPASKCAGLDDDVLNTFISCPELCNTKLGLGGSLDNLDEVAACMACVAADVVSTKNATLLGAPDPVLMSKDDAKCAQTIAKGYGKYLSTILKTRTKCQDTFEKSGGMGLDANCQNASDPDGKGKIGKAFVKAEAGVDKSCAAANLTNVGSCSTVDLPTLKTCAKTDSSTADDVGYPPHYAMAATICPVAVQSTILAGNGSGGSVSNTYLDVGWTGEGHNFDIPGEYAFEAAITCPNPSPPCGACTIDGVRPTGAIYDRLLRCTNDFTLSCDEPFMADADDCGGSLCTYVVGPPLPISAGGNPTCSVNSLALDLSGTVDVEAGQSDLNLNLATKIFTPGVQLQPCPVCVGDITPNDDVKDGLCEGDTAGVACDTHGFDETFASAANNQGLSLDCAPRAVSNISGSGLQIDLPFTTGSYTLGADNACDSPLGFLDCFCGQCSGDSLMACRNDAECAAVAAGTCSVKGGNGTSRQPNACGSFGNCVDQGDEKGECSDANLLSCDGISKANGGGFVRCLSNAECDITCAPIGGCGTCSHVEPTPCFLDPIEDTGVADPSNPTLVGNFCLAPTVSLSINATTGTPGPGRVAISQSVQLIY